MAGTADLSMRKLCERYGAAYTVAEMVSARGLVCGSKKSSALMDCSGQTGTYGVQLCISNPLDIPCSLELAMENEPEFIDLNMGCPAPKITSNGGGAVLMKDPKLAEKIISTAVRHSSVPITVKMRKGWDSSSVNCVEFAKMCESAGASAVTIHGRTRAQMYAPPVDLDIIEKVKRAVKIPVVANGDVCTPEDCKSMYDKTGCDMVLIGRAALGSPWLFAQINDFFATGSYTTPTLLEKFSVMREQIVDMVAIKGEYTGFREARKHCAWYLKDIPGARAMRAKCGMIESMSDVDNIINYALELSDKYAT